VAVDWLLSTFCQTPAEVSTIWEKTKWKNSSQPDHNSGTFSLLNLSPTVFQGTYSSLTDLQETLWALMCWHLKTDGCFWCAFSQLCEQPGAFCSYPHDVAAPSRPFPEMGATIGVQEFVCLMGEPWLLVPAPRDVCMYVCIYTYIYTLGFWIFFFFMFETIGQSAESSSLHPAPCTSDCTTQP